MKQKERIIIPVVFVLIAVVALLALCQPWRMNDTDFLPAASSGGATYNLSWDKQLKLDHDGYDPGWELILREEIRQGGQIKLSHLTETGIGGLAYGPGTPTPVATPSGDFGSLTGYDFDLSGLSGRAELWACLHWEASGETRLFMEFEGLTPDAGGFYLVGYVNLPYTYYFPIAAKGWQQ